VPREYGQRALRASVFMGLFARSPLDHSALIFWQTLSLAKAKAESRPLDG